MNEIIISTKGSVKNRAIHIISGVFDLIFAFFCFLFPSFAKDVFGMDAPNALFILCGLFFVITGVWSGLQYKFTTSFLDIYEDKYQGKGIQQFNVVDFDLNKSQIINLTVNETSIIITANGGTFKIMTNKEIAYKVFAHYNQTKNQ